MRQRLGLDAKKNTTPDMLFTLETVACLGACGLAPVLVELGRAGSTAEMTPEGAVALIEEIVAKEAVE